jgi:L-aspartate oxidase
MDATFDERRYLIPFRSILLPQIFTDTLVIGSGAAGMSAAAAAAQHGEVILLAKSALTKSNTAWAQGGIAGVLDDADSIDAHVQDTLAAGAGLCDEAAVRTICEAGPDALRHLLDAGFHADTEPGDDRQPALAREGGHSARRIIHAFGDATGKELARTLERVARETDRLRIFDNCFALDLITPNDDIGSPCLGAITHHPRYGLQMIWARATILAAGGAGAMWRETSNPPQATADGLALAYRAGATLGDLAFMQFHPTTLYVAGAERLLISEAVRGEGAYLLDSTKQRFMLDEHELAELAPRDVVAAAIHRAVARDRVPHVWLDARHVGGFRERFPSITARLGEFGLDPARDLIPVNPAAHYMVGGVRTDLFGRTDVSGLYAVGETACTGLHGANRLASNSLLEALVMGDRAGRRAAEMHPDSPLAESNGWGRTSSLESTQIVSNIPESTRGELDLNDVRSSLRSAMWRNVGIERTADHLADMQDMCDFWGRYTMDKTFDEPLGWETQNMLLVSALVSRSAAWRVESRGCHRRTDQPEQRDDYCVHDLWRRRAAEPHTTAVATATTAS